MKTEYFVAIAALSLHAVAHAQTYPNRPVRILVGSSPGGPIDFSARLAAQKLSEALGQSFVVENRTGAGGTIAGEVAAKAPADGYTLLTGSAATLCVAPALYPKLRYDSQKDFAPVTTITAATFALVVHPALPARSVAEFVALARSRPGQLTFGSAGSGSVTHLAAELFGQSAGIRLVHIPYKGAAPALVDLMSGQLHFTFDSLLTSVPHVKTGRLRALGVTSASRSALVPDLPTISEAGVKGYEASTWFGLLAPAGTPREIVVRLNAELVRALSTPETKERLIAQGLETVGNTPDQFAQLIRDELPKWARVVKLSGATVD